MPRRLIALICGLLLYSSTGQSETNGPALYAVHCAKCHSAKLARTPSHESLAQLSTRHIVKTLETGSMRVIGNFAINGPERIAIAEFLTGKKYNENWQAPPTRTCSTEDGKTMQSRSSWNGWSNDLGNTRFQNSEAARVNRENISTLTLQWSYGFPAESVMESQPTVLDGKLYIGSRSGTVNALNAFTACSYWKFQADGPVKTAIKIATIKFNNEDLSVAFFGDLIGNAYAIDIADGSLLWKKKMDEHIVTRLSAAFQFYNNVLYIPVSSGEEGAGGNPSYGCCKFRGSLVAVEPATGKEIWRTYTIQEDVTPQKITRHGTQLYGPSGAGIWTAATIDTKRELIYVTTSDNYSDPPTTSSNAVLALSLKTGELIWQYQGSANDAWNMACMLPDRSNCPDVDGPDEDMAASAILIESETGKDILIAAQKSSVVHALNPTDGSLLWKTRLGKGGPLGGIQWGAAADFNNVYVPLSDIAFDNESLFAPVLTPNPTVGGGLFALKLDDGKQLWRAPPSSCKGREKCSPAQSAAVTALPGVVFSGDVGGIMRAYDSETGEVIWEYDTVHDYDTVNKVKAHGGAVDGPGPVVVDGWVYFSSGYGKWGGLPGNVLLAFRVE